MRERDHKLLLVLYNDCYLHAGSKVSFLLLLVGCFLVVLSLALWIAVGFQVGLQESMDGHI